MSYRAPLKYKMHNSDVMYHIINSHTQVNIHAVVVFPVDNAARIKVHDFDAGFRWVRCIWPSCMGSEEFKVITHLDWYPWQDILMKVPTHTYRAVRIVMWKIADTTLFYKNVWFKWYVTVNCFNAKSDQPKLRSVHENCKGRNYSPYLNTFLNYGY